MNINIIMVHLSTAFLREGPCSQGILGVCGSGVPPYEFLNLYGVFKSRFLMLAVLICVPGARLQLGSGNLTGPVSKYLPGSVHSSKTINLDESACCSLGCRARRSHGRTRSYSTGSHGRSYVEYLGTTYVEYYVRADRRSLRTYYEYRTHVQLYGVRSTFVRPRLLPRSSETQLAAARKCQGAVELSARRQS
jgi:hypothetical protein